MGCMLNKVVHRSQAVDARVSTENQWSNKFEPVNSPSPALNTSYQNMRLPCMSTVPKGLPPEILSEKERLLHAIIKSDIREVKAILDRGNFNIDEPLDSQGNTASHIAAYCDPCLLQLLIAYGSDINRQSNDDGLLNTPLHVAALHDNKDTLKLLVDSGKADLSRVNTRGMTPFNLAFLNESYECLEILLSAGHDPNRELIPGITPLIAALSRGNVKMTELLTKYGSNVNDCHSSQTPLNIACATQNVKLVEILLKSGADPSPNNGHPTPLQVSQEANNQTIIGLLKSYAS